MQFPTTLTTLLLSTIASVSAITVSYDTGYDDASRSLNVVSCSDGSNGLVTKGYSTQGSLPNYNAYHGIGGVDSIAGWNSPNCGACYKLTYNGASINVIAVDHAASGFNIGQEALDKLTNGQAVAVGRIEAQIEQLGAADCGL